MNFPEVIHHGTPYPRFAAPRKSLSSAIMFLYRTQTRLPSFANEGSVNAANIRNNFF